MSLTAQGRFYEDFSLGDELVSARRTITEADVVGFAGVSGDFNALHTDELFAQTTPFGGRVAHGMLVVSAMTGQVNQAGWFAGTTLALLEMTTRFAGACKFGDTIQTVLEVTGLKETSKVDRGIVTLKTTIRNQRGETIVDG
ncbi:MAG: MaoC family dehydratase N-terminal domain-containing protein [Chloroflexi bacterium]|nr:MaoC family dehydratase N-terminal domain-containing protein [Chloroflexota bacterium]